MHKVLFVCHGNICRSPMAHYVLLDMVKKAGIADQFQITSVAVSREELGNPVYPPARRELHSHNIPCDGHRARQITQADVDGYEHIYYMDRSNLRWLSRIVGDKMEARAGSVLDGTGISGKVHMMMEFTGINRDVSDPWYTGDFEQTYQDVMAGCRGLLDIIEDTIAE